MSEREKMAAGEWYCCLDPELDALRDKARIAVHSHNTMPPAERGAMSPTLRALLGAAPKPFWKHPSTAPTASMSFLGKASI